MGRVVFCGEGESTWILYCVIIYACVIVPKMFCGLLFQPHVYCLSSWCCSCWQHVFTVLYECLRSTDRCPLEVLNGSKPAHDITHASRLPLRIFFRAVIHMHVDTRTDGSFAEKSSCDEHIHCSKHISKNECSALSVVPGAQTQGTTWKRGVPCTFSSLAISKCPLDTAAEKQHLGYNHLD